MQENTKLLSLFPIPVYTSVLEVTDKTKQDVKDLPFAPVKAKNGHMSLDKDLLNDPTFADLKALVDSHVQLYVKNIFSPVDSIEFVLTTSWAMKHYAGDWSNSHSHANAVISGIVYLETHPDSGSLVFTKTIENLSSGMLHIGVKEYNPFNADTWGITPENNQIVIFPSNLPHKVTPNNSSIERYCVAFNYFVKGILGQDEGKLIIS